MSQPYFERVWGWNSHSRNGVLGVLRDSRKFKVWLQRSKHLASGKFLYHWKSIEVYMSKMGSHDPFGHVQHKLWPKERSRFKLVVWFPTTESRESTRFPYMQVACDTSLESSRWRLQLWFRLRPDRRSAQEVLISQSWGTPILGDFGTPTWESQDKNPFRCHFHGVVHSILYGGRWWLTPSLGRGESCESRVARGLS
jgi:hypothetical protein